MLLRDTLSKSCWDNGVAKATNLIDIVYSHEHTSRSLWRFRVQANLKVFKASAFEDNKLDQIRIVKCVLIDYLNGVKDYKLCELELRWSTFIVNRCHLQWDLYGEKCKDLEVKVFEIMVEKIKLEVLSRETRDEEKFKTPTSNSNERKIYNGSWLSFDSW